MKINYKIFRRWRATPFSVVDSSTHTFRVIRTTHLIFCTLWCLGHHHQEIKLKLPNFYEKNWVRYMTTNKNLKHINKKKHSIKILYIVDSLDLFFQNDCIYIIEYILKNRNGIVHETNHVPSIFATFNYLS